MCCKLLGVLLLSHKGLPEQHSSVQQLHYLFHVEWQFFSSFFFPGKRVRSENNSPLFCSAIAMPTVFHSECCCLQAKQREKRQTTLFCLTVSSIFSCQVLFASFEQNIKRSHEQQIPVQYSHYCLVHAVRCCLLVSSKITREAPSNTYLFNSLIPYFHSECCCLLLSSKITRQAPSSTHLFHGLIPYFIPNVVACFSQAKPQEKRQAIHICLTVSFLIFVPNVVAYFSQVKPHDKL